MRTSKKLEDVHSDRDESKFSPVYKSIGKGNYGKVYSCTDHTGTCAIKCLADKKGSHMGGREYYRTIEIMKAINSTRQPSAYRNIVKCNNFREITCENDITVYTFDMSYYSTSLLDFMSEHIKHFTMVPTQYIVHILLGMFRGIDVLHRLGFVHNDIKPENMMLENGIAHGTVLLDVKLIDFGCMHHVRGEISPCLMGTTYYMAPEKYVKSNVAPGDSIHSATTNDIFSAGIVMFMLLTMRYPWANDKECKMFIKMYLTHDLAHSQAKLLEICNRGRDKVMRQSIDTDIHKTLFKWCYECLNLRREQRPSAHCMMVRMMELIH